jgi:hypothetical protein
MISPCPGGSRKAPASAETVAQATATVANEMKRIRRIRTTNHFSRLGLGPIKLRLNKSCHGTVALPRKTTTVAIRIAQFHSFR